MASHKLYEGICKPGDIKIAEEEIAKEEAHQANKLPVANPIRERHLAKVPKTEANILLQHWGAV